MKSPHLERWRTFEAKDARDAFSKLSNHFPPTDQGQSDIRGFPFGRENIRVDIRSHKFRNSDFSDANFANSNFFDLVFEDCLFERCDLSEVRMWDTNFINCKFVRCEFQNATMGRDCTYRKTDFSGSKLKGKYFSFGLHSRFEDCEFSNCKIQSAEICSVEFTRCSFSSQFTSVRLLGKFFAEIQKKDDKKAFPARVVDCDFRQSVFDKVEVFNDIESRNTKWPEQSFTEPRESRYYESGK